MTISYLSRSQNILVYRSHLYSVDPRVIPTKVRRKIQGCMSPINEAITIAWKPGNATRLRLDAESGQQPMELHENLAFGAIAGLIPCANNVGGLHVVVNGERAMRVRKKEWVDSDCVMLDILPFPLAENDYTLNTMKYFIKMDITYFYQSTC